jgi:hypothetical protein
MPAENESTSRTVWVRIFGRFEGVHRQVAPDHLFDRSSTAQAHEVRPWVRPSAQGVSQVTWHICHMWLRYRYRFYPMADQRRQLVHTFGCTSPSSYKDTGMVMIDAEDGCARRTGEGEIVESCPGCLASVIRDTYLNSFVFFRRVHRGGAAAASEGKGRVLLRAKWSKTRS